MAQCLHSKDTYNNWDMAAMNNNKMTQNRHILSQVGFTLIEIMIVMVIIGILAAIAIPVYQDNIVKAQASEAYRLAYGLKNNIATNVQDGTCFADSATSASVVEGVDKMTGIYGTAMIISGASGRPPCGIQYIFNSSDVSGQLQNKTIVMTVNKDSVLAKDSSTTVADKYLPQAIK